LPQPLQEHDCQHIFEIKATHDYPLYQTSKQILFKEIDGARETYCTYVSSTLQDILESIATYQTESIVHLQTEKWKDST
jgi:hypothetical protein